MHSSKIVEIDGVFVGAALKRPEETVWHFVSADERARLADGCTAPTLEDTEQLARRAIAAARAGRLMP